MQMASKPSVAAGKVSTVAVTDDEGRDSSIAVTKAAAVTTQAAATSPLPPRALPLRGRHCRHCYYDRQRPSRRCCECERGKVSRIVS